MVLEKKSWKQMLNNWNLTSVTFSHHRRNCDNRHIERNKLNVSCNLLLSSSWRTLMAAQHMSKKREVKWDANKICENISLIFDFQKGDTRDVVEWILESPVKKGEFVIGFIHSSRLLETCECSRRYVSCNMAEEKRKEKNRIFHLKLIVWVKFMQIEYLSLRHYSSCCIGTRLILTHSITVREGESKFLVAASLESFHDRLRYFMVSEDSANTHTP